MVRDKSRRRFLQLAAAGATSAGVSRIATTRGRALPAVGGPSVIGQTGRIVAGQSDPDRWARVSFDIPFALTPVVIMNPVTANEAAPVDVHIRKVTRNGFEFRLEEWDYQDGEHAAEELHFLAMARGVHELVGALLNAEAGFVAANTTAQSVSFTQSFSQRPTVFAQAQTHNGRRGDAAGKGDSITTRVDVAGTNQFTVKLQEQERYQQFHRSETVGYIALEPGEGILDPPLGKLDSILGGFEVDATTQTVTHDDYPLEFANDYDSPICLADMQTLAGHNTATTRVSDIDGTGATVAVEEEQSADTEVEHVPEAIGYAVFEDDALLYV
ncbi:H-type lectin domain-containing protein [Halocatena marina]|uniref:H-type lectin domain-containing protein n=1 Tax=Halocatena marina TaxID=2934937 RepID=UPI00200EF157|nr:H-type lectin domain-containing protein [Halocatena marina]